MRFISGKIYSKMSDVVCDLPAGSVVRILLFDASDRLVNRQANAKLIGKTEITNVRSFPIDYKIEYAESNSDPSAKLFYFLTVYIETPGDQVIFNNNSKMLKSNLNRLFLSNEYGDLIARNTSKVRRHLDVFLNSLSV